MAQINPTTTRRKWHKDSIFGDGPRLPMDRERRAVWNARLQMHRRSGRITASESYVGIWLIKSLGTDGRLDPSHETLADRCGESVSTVKRALKHLRDLGMVTWVRRIVRVGWRAAQTSNAYMLTLGEVPKMQAIRPPRCDGQMGRETRKQAFGTFHPKLEVDYKSQMDAKSALEQIAKARQEKINAEARHRLEGRFGRFRPK